MWRGGWGFMTNSVWFGHGPYTGQSNTLIGVVGTSNLSLLLHILLHDIGRTTLNGRFVQEYIKS